MLFLKRPKPYDSGATGELNIEALGWSHGRQSSWGDRKRWTLEDRLPQLMRELETQAVEAEERRLAKEREEAERQRQWEAAMDSAKLRLIEDHRLNVLRNRVAAWHEADAIRAYCDAVEARHGDRCHRCRLPTPYGGLHSPGSTPTAPSDSRECRPTPNHARSAQAIPRQVEPVRTPRLVTSLVAVAHPPSWERAPCPRAPSWVALPRPLRQGKFDAVAAGAPAP